MLDVGCRSKKVQKVSELLKKKKKFNNIAMVFLFSSICLSDSGGCGWFHYFRKNFMKLKKFMCLMGYAGINPSLMKFPVWEITYRLNSVKVRLSWKAKANVALLSDGFAENWNLMFTLNSDNKKCEPQLPNIIPKSLSYQCECVLLVSYDGNEINILSMSSRFGRNNNDCNLEKKVSLR